MIRDGKSGSALARSLIAVAILAASVCLSWFGARAARVDAGESRAVGIALLQPACEASIVPARQTNERELESRPFPRNAALIAGGDPERICRDVHVVDQDDIAVEGAQLVADAVWDASGDLRIGKLLGTTDSLGRSRVMAARPLDWVSVIAAGHRLEGVQVPPENVPWVVRLARANRIEIALLGDAELSGFHAEIRLPSSFRQRTFYQDLYVQTPGRVVEGARGRWAEDRDGSNWSVCFASDRRAVVDQLFDSGRIAVSLCRFGSEIERRDIELFAEGRCVRVEFMAPRSPPRLQGVVVDSFDRPIAGASLRLAPFGGSRSFDASVGFPIWAPSALSAADGSFSLPRPDDAAERCVVTKHGFADRVLRIDELDSMQHRVQLEPGRVVLLEAVDRNGESMDGGWETGGHNYVQPSVLIAHDVWRAVHEGGLPAGLDESPSPPWFVCDDLPTAVVRFRFTYHKDDEVLVHDTRNGIARFVSPRAVDELQIGK